MMLLDQIRQGCPCVLVIDDFAPLAENIAEILSIEGYATKVAYSAGDGLRKARSREIGVVVTDYSLPEMNGAELVRRVRGFRGDVRCIVISAQDDEATVDEALSAGASFLGKPLDLPRLVRMVAGYDS